MISSEKEYHESLAVDVSVNGFLESSMASASFKANVEYKKNVDTLTKTDAVFVQVFLFFFLFLFFFFFFFYKV